VTSYSSLDELSVHDAWLTIGIFDGVHRGHQEILHRLVAGARQAGAPAVVLTFHPHPAVVLGGKTDFKALSTPEERIELLESFGVDLVVKQTFDQAFANQTAADFMQRISRTLGLKCLVLGYDSALGRGREGNAARLTEIGQELGFAVQVVPPVADERGILSSTRIRAAIAAGRVDAAAADLGRNYSVSGPVVHGDGRGHRINFPTANIQVPDGKILPANGIYACWAWVDGKKIPAATNVGVRPTFTPDLPAPTVEAYLLDFGRDIYGKEIKLEFVDYLRPEERYDSVQDLLDQIALDVLDCRKILMVK